MTSRVHTEESGARMDRAYCLGVGRPGSVPFVSHRPPVTGCVCAVENWIIGVLGLAPACDAGRLEGGLSGLCAHRLRSAD